MNISSMVNQSTLANNVTNRYRAKNRKDSPDPTGPSTFAEKLREFRKENAVAKVAVAPDQKQEEEQKVGRDLWTAICSGQLFSPWDEEMTAEEALKKLDRNLSQIGTYTPDSDLDPVEVIDHLAAQYSVYKQHLDKSGTLEQLEALDAMVLQHTKKYAEEFSEVVGGFFEENGMVGERDKIEYSIMTRIRNMTKEYDEFIAKDPAAFDALRLDSQQNKKSLSNELRQARLDSGVGGTGYRPDLEYTDIELSDAANLVKLSKDILELGAAQVTNEEELGIKLGKLTLQGLELLQNSWASSAHKDTFMESIRKKGDGYLDKIDELLMSEGAISDQNSEDEAEGMTHLLDRDAVYAVVNAMVGKYHETQSMGDAIKAGMRFGLRQYLSKKESMDDVERYHGSPFWSNSMNGLLENSRPGNLAYDWVKELLEESQIPFSEGMLNLRV